MPTAEIVSSGCFIQLSDSPATINGILAQRAVKPISHSSVITGGSGQTNLVIIVDRFTRILVSYDILKPGIIFIINGGYLDPDTVFLASIVFPDDTAGVEATQETVFFQK
jgi:hypothetical protein